MRLSGHAIVCPSSRDWDHCEGSNRPALVSRLAELNRLLVIDPPSGWSQALRGLLRGQGPEGWVALVSPHGRLRRIAHNLHVLTPPTSLGLPGLDRRRLVAAVRRACDELDLSEPILWLDPAWEGAAELIGQLGEILVVGQTASAEAPLGAAARAVLARSELAFVSASDQLGGLGCKAHVIPEAIDFERFNRALFAETPLPPELERLPRPIVTAIGPIDDHFDFALWDFLARERPQWGFVALGRVAVSLQARRPNMVFLGDRLDELLPGALKASAVVAQVFRGDGQRGTLLYELAASGKPVVSLDLAAADLACVATDPRDFLAALEAAMAQDGPRAVFQRIQLARQRTWERLCHQFEGAVLEALAARAEPSTIPLLVERVIRAVR